MRIDDFAKPTEYTAVTGTETDWLSIDSPELLHIQDGESISYGAHQVWYSSWWNRVSGCGPTTTSNLLWYLVTSRPERCGNLFAGDGSERAGMLRLMEMVWQYVKPSLRGVNKASTLIDGAIRYGAERGVVLKARLLEIPEAAAARPSTGEVLDFLTAAFSDDLPVAFLNLSNGTVKNLDNWHWVTLVSTDAALQAEMYDQSKRQYIDLKQWLASTTGGGAFVVLEPAQ